MCSRRQTAVATRWGNILDFQGFNLITPNEKKVVSRLETRLVVRPLAKKIHDASSCETLILKCGERGIITYTEQSDDYRSFFAIDSFATQVKDSVGAGDALLAYAALSLNQTKNPLIASILGCLAAGLECELDGNHPINVDRLSDRLRLLEKSCNYEV